MGKNRSDKASKISRLKRAAHVCRLKGKRKGNGYRVRIRNALRL